jgi:hypothetical protein
MKLQQLFQRALMAGVLGTSLCLALPAQAGTLIGTGYTIGSQTFGLSTGQTVGAGGFSGTWNGDPLQFWCAQLSQTFSFGNAYEYTASIPNNATFTRLGELFHEAYGAGVGQALHDTEHSAAFQLAIWEILFDGTDLNLSGGGFKVTNNHGNAAAVADAQTWLNNLGSSTDNIDVTFLANEVHQDFITGTPPKNCCRQEVPEPAPLTLLAAGLVAMIVASRRRTPKVPPA